MIQNSKFVFSAAEKQPIVSSKQPIVLCLTALKIIYLILFEFLSIADHNYERIIGQ